jgi:ribonuclease HII|tara:strand:+ start:1111 stop:1713 length:603 start_codon:yes stop_codon:yes gene_type:complete
VTEKISLLEFDAEFSRPLAGVDEVGRGPLAGPVVAAAVILDFSNIPKGINDSKKISKIKRENINKEIINSSTISIGQASVVEIDKINILQASLLAMQRAINGLKTTPKIVLVDGIYAPLVNVKTETVVKGDSHSLSIAAASIVAKVFRDKLMKNYSSQYPGYLWEKNSGYGTKEHLEAIKRLGVTPIHRTSFKPIYNMLN